MNDATRILQSCLEKTELDGDETQRIKDCLQDMIREKCRYWAPEQYILNSLECVQSILCAHDLTRSCQRFFMGWSAELSVEYWRVFQDVHRNLDFDPLLAAAIRFFEGKSLVIDKIRQLRFNGGVFLCESPDRCTSQSPTLASIVRSDGSLTTRPVWFLDFKTIRWEATDEEIQTTCFKRGDYLSKHVLSVFV